VKEGSLANHVIVPEILFSVPTIGESRSKQTNIRDCVRRRLRMQRSHPALSVANTVTDFYKVPTDRGRWRSARANAPAPPCRPPTSGVRHLVTRLYRMADNFTCLRRADERTNCVVSPTSVETGAMRRRRGSVLHTPIAFIYDRRS